ncbi:MAG: glycosyltransferase family 39 protein [Gemmataceae bacterium]|nr:glycosyltransferase family 39 protein [Gemmataceae bacterium]MDW8266223.1 glycosyltransferase family 39 protein [Gemmataceae bacterium]
MFRLLSTRPGHYLLLTLVSAALTLPNLGGPSLWDVDEGRNAEAAREMLESDNWIVPTFNYELRVDKPALLYWLQIAAYRWFGINEFAARLPSALAAWVTVCCVYELGRAMFSAATGVLAGLALASAGMFCAAAHFANPDALLTATSTLNLTTFWLGHVGGWRWWPIPAAAFAGLAFLSKGPVGLVLPAAIIVLYLLLTRGLWRALSVHWLLGLGVFLLVTVPWFALVTVETKGTFPITFFLRHNVERFLAPMEKHHGPIIYYPVVLFLGFVPWSAFLPAALRHAWRCRLPDEPAGERPESAPHRPGLFLSIWAGVYVLFFTCSQTKLPNYVLPAYPVLALATAWFLDSWRQGRWPLADGWLRASLVLLAGMGMVAALVCVVASGVVPLRVLRGHAFPEALSWTPLGLIPLLGAWLGVRCLRRQQRTEALSAVAVGNILFVGILATGIISAVEPHKAPRSLVERNHLCQTDREIRLAAYDYFQPSLVFYGRRQVEVLHDELVLRSLLQGPFPAYVFVPATTWERLRPRMPADCRVLDQRRDFYVNRDVVVVSNR